MACYCWWSWDVRVMSCWRDAFVCIACLLIVAIVCTERFAMCEWIVPAIVSAVSLLESLILQGRQSGYFGHTHLVWKWLFLMWGAPGRLLGWRDGDWSTFGWQVTCAPNSQYCAFKGRILRWGLRHLWGCRYKFSWKAISTYMSLSLARLCGQWQLFGDLARIARD